MREKRDKRKKVRIGSRVSLEIDRMMGPEKTYELPPKKARIEEEEEAYDEEEEEDTEWESREEEDESDAYFEENFGHCDEELKKEIRRYIDTLAEVGPYNIDFIPDCYFFCAVVPIALPPAPDEDYYPYEEAQKSLQFAIDQHNEGKDSKLVLDKIVRANYRRACGFIFFIIFEATDAGSGEKGTYRTCVEDDTIDKIMTLKEFHKVEKEELKDASGM